jgi:hypothetical protein
VSITLFFVDAFTSALDRGMATEADLLRHFTPEVLAEQLPRPLWARLLTACLGASQVTAVTVVDTIGVSNLCEHLPKPLLWTCLAEIAATALGGAVSAAAPATASAPVMTSAARRAGSSEMLLPPPPASAPRIEPSSAEPITPLDSTRTRTPTRPPGRAINASRLPSAATAARRPQAAAAAPTAAPAPSAPAATPLGRAPTPAPLFSPPPRGEELDFEIETDIRSDWKDRDPIPVDDEQLVDWSSSEETMSGSSLDRPKRS